MYITPSLKEEKTKRHQWAAQIGVQNQAEPHSVEW